MNIGVIDGSFPQKLPFGFRNREINGLLEINQSTVTLSPFIMFAGEDAFFDHAYGSTREDFDDRKAGYLKHYKYNQRRIQFLQKSYDKPFLAFSYFLADTYTYLPFLEENKLPFCFVLYPGGGFGVNNPSSDAMLTKIFTSPYFRKVIVTSDVTNTYLREAALCDPEKIEMLWCGVPQFESSDFKRNEFYPESKKVVDILFVAYKYSDGGYDKGYDLYIDAAKKVVEQNKNTVFHVVGNFAEEDYDITGIKENIIFHGLLARDKMLELYESVDMQVGLSRSNVLFNGNFDGFPLGFEAMRAGALLITSDTLGQNAGRFTADELCLVPLDAEEIASKINFFIENPELMKATSSNGREAIDRLLNTDVRIAKLNDILMKEAANE